MSRKKGTPSSATSLRKTQKISHAHKTHIVLIAPSDVTFGEGTILYTLARELPEKEFRISFYLGCESLDPLRNEQWKKLFQRYGFNTFFKKALSPSNELILNKTSLRKLTEDCPDLILMAGWYHSLASGGWMNWLVEPVIEPLRKAGVATGLLDVSGAIFYEKTPPFWGLFSMRPFTWKKEKETVALFHINPPEKKKRQPSPHRPKVLWCRHTWLGIQGRDQDFRVVEKEIFKIFQELKIEVDLYVNSVEKDEPPSSISMDIFPQCATYEDYQEKLSELSLFITMNATSVLAARATALGVPPIFVNALDWVPNIRKNPAFKYPAPYEYHEIYLKEHSENVKAFQWVFENLNFLQEQLNQRLEKIHSTLPSPSQVIQSFLNHSS